MRLLPTISFLVWGGGAIASPLSDVIDICSTRGFETNIQSGVDALTASGWRLLAASDEDFVNGNYLQATIISSLLSYDLSKPLDDFQDILQIYLDEQYRRQAAESAYWHDLVLPADQVAARRVLEAPDGSTQVAFTHAGSAPCEILASDSAEFRRAATSIPESDLIFYRPDLVESSYRSPWNIDNGGIASSLILNTDLLSTFASQPFTVKYIIRIHGPHN